MTPSSEDWQWFVLRDLKRPNAKNPAFRSLAEAGFEVFTPLETKIVVREGRRLKEEVPVIRDMLFVNSSRAKLDPVVGRVDTLQYRYVKGGGYCQPLVVPSDEMDRFISLVNSAVKVEYLRPEEITPAMIGAEVRIIADGPFNAKTGRITFLKGSKKKLIVQISDLIAAKVELAPEFIEILSAPAPKTQTL